MEKKPLTNKKEEVLNLFLERDKTFFAITEDIFDYFHNAIEAVNEIIGLETAQFLEWKNAELDEDTIGMMGIVNFPLEYTLLQDDGTSITITKENQEDNSRLIKVALPIDVALERSTEDIYEYFQSAKKYSESEEAEEIPKDQEKWIDTNNLTEEQLKSLLTYTGNVTKSKIN